MVRRDSKSRPETLERPGAPATRALDTVAREVSRGRTTVLLSRDLVAGTREVWDLLTRPHQLSKWAPFTSDRDLAHVGRAVLTMLGDASDTEIPSVILVADAPAVLEYTWASDVVAWHVTNVGVDSRVTLRQTLADAATASAVAAGWHLCLDVAESVLSGSPLSPIRGMDAMNHGWQELNELYAAALGVEPTRTS